MTQYMTGATSTQPYKLSAPMVHGIDALSMVNPGLNPLVQNVVDVNKAVEQQTPGSHNPVPHPLIESPDPQVSGNDMFNQTLLHVDVMGYAMPVGDISKPWQAITQTSDRWTARHTPQYYNSTRSYGHDWAETFNGDRHSMAGLSQQGRVIAPGGQIKRFREMTRVIPLPLADTVGAPTGYSQPAVIPLVTSQDGGLQWY